jgi:hypothetical protein
MHVDFIRYSYSFVNSAVPPKILDSVRTETEYRYDVCRAVNPLKPNGNYTYQLL